MQKMSFKLVKLHPLYISLFLIEYNVLGDGLKSRKVIGYSPKQNES